ncbi:DUF3139 domain-containing protein (plasmid) [Clostridium botulinum]|uniref:DUF3139 domain-containing protein n=1 Tax=Clostridium botulinum C/D str. DC5 TaxID=1443128 RepID=A0A0A0I165_CLOBO|nr:DUF3139 domain-containing protein [Clostridium botulinum]KEH96585.1 hypothetical protein Z953_p0165 [Clostridium botulinum D str. 16868]KGM93370.1 hypothetical protein Z955_15490 [Clostridium botulinum C/D str. DC5]KOC56946.1 hypothetical protein ADU89_01780 [Clostridium botulinum]KOC57421.1 hypothetical protein ADU90_06320 [Clostridium botulinum]MCD3232662.1 DUF3139 domain-containing protein [Clostridium botulinum D/C]
MKKFKRKYVFIVAVILLVFNNISLRYKIYFIGDQKEREQILNSTVWKLYKDGYHENEIRNVRVYYNPIKGGLLPYEVLVVFNKDPSKEYIYSWTDVNKKQKRVECVGDGASSF